MLTGTTQRCTPQPYESSVNMSSAKPTHDAGQLQFEWSEPRPTDEHSPRGQPHVQIKESIAGDSEPKPAPGVSPPHDSNQPTASKCSYDPGHPWHYLARGDHAPPVPFDDIPASEESAQAMQRELPKPIARRIVALRDRVEFEKRELAAARVRYQEIVDRGAEALGRYDREIAYGGNDDMARAGTLALLFNQAAWRKGRIAGLECEQSRGIQRRR